MCLYMRDEQYYDETGDTKGRADVERGLQVDAAGKEAADDRPEDDPGIDGAAVDAVCQAALLRRGAIVDIGLVTYVKSAGGHPLQQAGDEHGSEVSGDCVGKSGGGEEQDAATHHRFAADMVREHAEGELEQKAEGEHSHQQADLVLIEPQLVGVRGKYGHQHQESGSEHGAAEGEGVDAPVQSLQ